MPTRSTQPGTCCWVRTARARRPLMEKGRAAAMDGDNRGARIWLARRTWLRQQDVDDGEDDDQCGPAG
jgi:hypothetical protein